MPNVSAEQTIRDMVRQIAIRFRPEQVILVGSYAKGTAGPDSDVDLLVIMRPEGSKRQQATKIDIALKDAPLPKDVIVVTPEDVERQRNIIGTVIYPALREGKVMYERAA